MLGLLNLTSLPFFASWEGILLYSSTNQPAVYIFLIVQGLLTAGYFRYIRIRKRAKLGAERWVLLIYPFGLVLLPLVHLALAYFGDPSYRAFSSAIQGNFLQSWPGFAVTLLAGFFWNFYNRFQSKIKHLISRIGNLYSLDWLYKLLKFLFNTTDRSFNLINGIFEGTGGIFWSILLLVLVIALIIQT